MIAAPSLSGVSPCQTHNENQRWPSDGKGTTIGVGRVGLIVYHKGVSPCCTNPPGRKGPQPQ